MSILIKNMEMPKDGTFSIVHIYSDGHVSMPVWGKGMQIVSGIIAVPVPPHGRLVDADSMEKEVCGGCVHGKHKYANCIDCALANAPTVIPTEQPKGEE